jgi:aldehyde dehydrogenase (NAD+)
LTVINRFADLIERDGAHLAALESFDSGKGVKIALDSDVGDTVACLRFFAGLSDKIHGQTIDCFGQEKMVYTLHEPIGVCGQIIPWVRLPPPDSASMVPGQR